MDRVLVAGATGRLGAEVVAALRRQGRTVRALSRHPAESAGRADEVVAADLRDPASLAAACRGVDAVISAAGASLSLGLRPGAPDFRRVDYAGNRNLLAAARAAGVRKFVYVSVYSTPAYAHLDYVRAHTDFARLLAASGTPYAVVQPTGFFSSFALFPRLARLGVAPLVGAGTARTNPIHEQDVAEVCVAALDGAPEALPVGGPDVLTRRAIFELAFEAAGRPPRFVRVPDAALGVARRLVAPFDRRLAHLLHFLQVVNHHDVVAPCVGTRRLRDFFGAG